MLHPCHGILWHFFRIWSISRFRYLAVTDAYKHTTVTECEGEKKMPSTKSARVTKDKPSKKQGWQKRASQAVHQEPLWKPKPGPAEEPRPERPGRGGEPTTGPEPRAAKGTKASITQSAQSCRRCAKQTENPSNNYGKLFDGSGAL